MTLRQQWGAVLVVVIALAGALWAATSLLGDELFPVTVGSEAPPFTAYTIDAEREERSIGDYRGEVVLLNIWATWCAPCRTEMPAIQALHERFSERGLKVVAVSIDQPGAEDVIRDFAAELGLTFEILHEPSGDIQRRYQTVGVPETFVIGRDGVIRKKQIGHQDWDSDANRRLVASLLGVADAPAGGDAPESVPVAPAGL